MEREFNFGAAVEICGKEYRLDVSGPGVVDRIRNLEGKMQTALKKAEETEDIGGVVNVSRDFVDSLLGHGAFDAIFAGRTITPMDLSALFVFLTEAIKEHSKEQAAVIGDSSEN